MKKSGNGKRFVGAIFCFIAAMLFVSRYIATAIYLSGTSYFEELFSQALKYVGSELNTLSFLSLVCGIGYLVWAEKSERDQE